jgi:hypothetical protein
MSAKVADEMLALARRLAIAADGGAESGQEQGPHQTRHGRKIARHQRLRLSKQLRLVGRQQHERHRAVGAVEEQMGQQPVGLRRRPAQAVAEPGADHARRRRCQNREIEEDAERGLCGKRFL